MIAAVRRTGEVNGARRAGRLSRRFLASDTARLAAAAAAYERKVGGLVGADGDALKAVFAALPAMDPYKPSRGRLLAVPREKFDGSFRWVFSAKFVDHAVGLLVKYALEGLCTPEPTQFMSTGGRAGFERWLRTELPAAALVITTDIPSCFESLLRDAVISGLPLPAAVKKAVLFDPKDRALFLDVAPGGLTPMNKEKVAVVSAHKRGIPQGTAPASIVSEAMIAPIIRAINDTSPDVFAASFGDNLIVVLRNAKDRTSVIDALTSSVRDTFGADVIGPLTSRTRITSPRRGVSFCGREYRLHRGKMRVELSAGRLDKFALKTLVRIRDAKRSKDPVAFAAIRESINGWVAQNAVIPGAVSVAVDLLIHLESMAPKEAAYTFEDDPDGTPTVGELIMAEDTDPPWVESL
ncbi:hypothetical protein GCM10009116_15740 [Brevundimonas basaltis]|uniref:Reverse transcriptase domain-containing protein n=1 Tax=Brevundimonas basaltis TaxID=472166 RepID=A0A7W8HWT7_9CAUL|nr:hypothetical protein [Brevundimonas basaltis]MBB5291114.1 hypothetical protein [Brevundimonas basaltis]